MATVLTHPVVPLAIGPGLGRDVVPNPLLIAGVAVSALPDLNVLAFRQLYGNSTILIIKPFNVQELYICESSAQCRYVSLGGTFPIKSPSGGSRSHKSTFKSNYKRRKAPWLRES